MKKTFAIGMSLLLAASYMPVYAESTSTAEQESVAEAASNAEEVSQYQLGDKIEDFTVTLSDGSEVSLYQLLSEKKAVLINFWASWCGPCQAEFPAMQAAYDEVSDDVGVIALSAYELDTDKVVDKVKDSLGLTTLPMGVDTIGLKNHFDTDAIPLSIIVDRNGVICFMESGALTDEDDFLSLFDVYTADDYDEPQLLDGVPSPLPTVAAPSAEEMKQVLGGTDDMEFIPAEDNIWPFVVSDDGTYLRASNGAVQGTEAMFAVKVNVEEGQALSFEYATSCLIHYQGLYVSVDGEICAVLSGDDAEWKQKCIQFDEPGEHTVTFDYVRDMNYSGDTSAAVRNIQMVSTEEAEKAAEGQVSVKTLEGSEISVEVVEGETKDAALVLMKDGEVQEIDEAAAHNPVVQGDGLTLRICIGEDVDASDAFYTDGTYYHMLNELPTDEQGYLYTISTTDWTNDVVQFAVYPSLTEDANIRLEGGTPEAAATFNAVPGEHAMDEFTESYEKFALSLLGADATDEEMEQAKARASLVWVYFDGSARTTEPEVKAESYTVYVADEDGNPVAGAMVQICDDTTCQVFVTDDQGMVSCPAAQDAYDVHILTVPDGYETPDDLFNVSQDQSTISITLQKAE